jgi:hypothetical protein
MLESNPSRNRRLKTHLNGERGVRLVGWRLDHCFCRDKAYCSRCNLSTGVLSLGFPPFRAPPYAS